MAYIGGYNLPSCICTQFWNLSANKYTTHYHSDTQGIQDEYYILQNVDSIQPSRIVVKKVINQDSGNLYLMGFWCLSKNGIVFSESGFKRREMNRYFQTSE